MCCARWQAGKALHEAHLYAQRRHAAWFQRSRVRASRSSCSAPGFPRCAPAMTEKALSGSDTILFDGKAVLAGSHGRRSGRRPFHRNSGELEQGLTTFRSPAVDDRRGGGSIRLQRSCRRLAPGGPSPAQRRLRLRKIFATLSPGCSAVQPATSSSSWRWSWPENAGRTRAGTSRVAPAFRDDLRVIGKSHRKIDGMKLAAGMKAYVEDRVETGSCVLVMLRSPHAHAFIRHIDTAEAQRLPGRGAGDRLPQLSRRCVRPGRPGFSGAFALRLPHVQPHGAARGGQGCSRGGG